MWLLLIVVIPLLVGLAQLGADLINDKSHVLKFIGALLAFPGPSLIIGFIVTIIIIPPRDGLFPAWFIISVIILLFIALLVSFGEKNK